MKTVQIPSETHKPKWGTRDMPRSSQIALACFSEGVARDLGAGDQENALGNTRDEVATYSESEWTMSRRPNRRESSENAPGPKRKSAAVTLNENAN